ncbi:MAG: hypothetical protein AAGN82_18080 [Myxococcota bacterium]
MPTSSRRAWSRLRGRWTVFSGLLLLSGSIAGCPRTTFYDEGPGQPSDRALGVAPPGTIGACRVPDTERPVLVDAGLWEDLDDCNKRTPRRYLRLGVEPTGVGATSAGGEERKRLILEGLAAAEREEQGNLKMLTMLRAVRQIAAGDERLKGRVERASGRSQPCDYAYLFKTMRKADSAAASGADGTCAVLVFDPKLRRERCLFDRSVPEGSWLTGAWPCLAFTETVGEGQSCYQRCAFDDYCASQTSCAQPDFDLVLCALGICMPESVAGIVPVRR